MRPRAIIAGIIIFISLLNYENCVFGGTTEAVLLSPSVGRKIRSSPGSKDKNTQWPDLPIADQDLISGEKLPNPPDDPCLPALYKNWQELSQDQMDSERCSNLRMVIDRSDFKLKIECENGLGSIDEIYESEVGLGDLHSPTPAGQFVINHIYCYPDVVFFSSKNERIPALYNGFFAPLLLCEREGRCRRYHELGIHGFQASAHPNPSNINRETTGAVSAGCIRIPDPCRVKRVLISKVGIGDLHKNDRGFYYWLQRPVDVEIVGDYPGQEEYLNLVNLFEKSLSQVQEGMKGLLDLFGRDDTNN